MKKDPYVEIIMMMQKEGAKSNPPSFCLGKVVSETPLEIKVDELLLDADDFLIADYLIEGYKRSLQVTSQGTMSNNGNSSMNGTLVSSTQNTSGGSGEDSFASHNHSINNQATFNGMCESNGKYTLSGQGTMSNNGESSIQGNLTSSTQNTYGGSGDNSFASHNHSISNQATFNGMCESNGKYTLSGESEVEFKPYLKKGDLLALMPMEGEQLYIVLCKLVSLV